MRAWRSSEWSWAGVDRALRDTFLSEALPVEQRYRELFSYFVSGFLTYRTPDGANARYPGVPSHHGKRADEMEGFARIAPLIGAWLASGRDARIETSRGMPVDLTEVVRTGWLAGTDPGSPGFWGRMDDHDQRIHEAADVALSIWLLRDSVWKSLDVPAQRRIEAWLSQVNERQFSDNNWHHIPVIVDTVLQTLGRPVPGAPAAAHYRRWKEFYRGDGWFSDGPAGIFDYYNAWGMHYTLFWVDAIDPGFDPAFIRTSLREFLGTYKHFISPAGIPIMGRSIAYRTAATAPLAAGALRCPDVVSPGMARRALDRVWRYYLEKGAVAGGNIVQGYFGRNLRFLDNYCGPATCLWGLRSLIIALFFPPESDFWTAPEEPLPVERGDFEVDIPAIGWKVRGVRATGEVRLIIPANEGNGGFKVRKYGLIRRAKGLVKGRPFRPQNRDLAYKLPEYSSARPFCETPPHKP